MRGATRSGNIGMYKITFQLTRPMRGATEVYRKAIRDVGISTHTPHAGRDILDAGLFRAV